MLRLEVLTPEALALAPALCAALEGTPFILAGGTGLALQLGHRISVDFDWFCSPERFPKDIATRLAGLDRGMTVIQDSRDTFDCLLTGVKCSFFGYRPVLETAPERFHGCLLGTVADIGVMKLVAMAQRGAKKDFFEICTKS